MELLLLFVFYGLGGLVLFCLQCLSVDIAAKIKLNFRGLYELCFRIVFNIPIDFLSPSFLTNLEVCMVDAVNPGPIRRLRVF